MDDDDDDDFGFSDADLDDLPAKTLQHLEATAIRATQQQPKPWTTAGPESDYGLEDGDEVINLDDGDEVADTDQHQHQHQHQEGQPPYQSQWPSQSHSQSQSHQPPQWKSQPDPAHLLQRIKKLEQEKAREKRDAQALHAQLQTKAGEADTLRRRHDADARLHERRLADQQQAYATELARLRADMDKLRRDRESALTDTMFNQHDAREIGLARRTAKTKTMASRPKSTAPAAPSPATTPRRAVKTRGFVGDGFDDDDDVIMASPSKLRDRLKSATPKHGGKRKRLVADQSPIPLPALQLSAPRSRSKENAAESASDETATHVNLLQNYRPEDHRFAFLHRLLAQPSSNGQDRILEALTQHAFPSQPTKRLSSILYDALATGSTPHVQDLALHVADIFLNLWKRCHSEKYYAPTYLILDTLHFLLACEPTETVVQLADRAVPLIIASIDLVSDPVSKAAKGGSSAVAALYSPAQQAIASQIDVLDCLDILYMIAASSVSCSDPEEIVHFWETIPSTFVCMLLVKEQPYAHITVMLRILSTSALDQTLGPITLVNSASESQSSNEEALLNRLTNLLTETPRVIPDPSAASSPPIEVSEADTWDLRLLVLSVLTQFSISSFAYKRLAKNRLCVGRLIKYLDYCITSLYRQPLSPTQDRKVESINTTMKLIYHIATDNVDFDIKSKLVNTLGGQHAYLVALTRLAFSEGLLLEHGIEDEVVNMAHDILDEGLSMEEGDAFGKVYSSGGTSSG